MNEHQITLQCCLSSITTRSIWLLTKRFFDVVKFTTQNSLSLLISCKLSFLIVGLKVSFLPTFTLKSPNQIFMWCFRNWLHTHYSPSQKLSLYHDFYPKLGHADSEQWHHISDLWNTDVPTTLLNCVGIVKFCLENNKPIYIL